MSLIPTPRRVHLHVTNDSGGTVMMRIDGDGRHMLSKDARQLLMLVGMNTSTQVGHDCRFGHTLAFDASQINDLASGPAVIGTVKARVRFHEVTDNSREVASVRRRLNMREALQAAHATVVAQSPHSSNQPAAA